MRSELAANGQTADTLQTEPHCSSSWDVDDLTLGETVGGRQFEARVTERDRRVGR